MDPKSMTYTRPYLLRAIYEWVNDNNCTPYIVVNTTYDDVVVPEQYIENDKIVLNISPIAVQGLQLKNDHVEFDARFAGDSMHIYIPILSIIAIYAKENGRGMVFSEDEEGTLPPGDDDDSGRGKSAKGRPKLTIVK